MFVQHISLPLFQTPSTNIAAMTFHLYDPEWLGSQLVTRTIPPPNTEDPWSNHFPVIDRKQHDHMTDPHVESYITLH